MDIAKLEERFENISHQALMLGFNLEYLLSYDWWKQGNVVHLLEGFELTDDGFKYLSDLSELKCEPSDIFFYKDILNINHPVGLVITSDYKDRQLLTYGKFDGDFYKVLEYHQGDTVCRMNEFSIVNDLEMSFQGYSIPKVEAKEFIDSENYEGLIDLFSESLVEPVIIKMPNINIRQFCEESRYDIASVLDTAFDIIYLMEEDVMDRDNAQEFYDNCCSQSDTLENIEIGLSNESILEAALMILSERLNYPLRAENINGLKRYFTTHCSKCFDVWDSGYLSTWGMCLHCYAEMVG